MRFGGAITSQPQGRPVIDRANPLTRGLIVGGVGGQPVYIGGVAPYTRFGVAPEKVTEHGIAMRGGSMQQIARDLTVVSSITLLCITEVNTSTSAISGSFSLSHNGGTETFAITTADGTTAGKISGRIYLGGYRTIGGSVTLNDGDIFVGVLRHRHNTSQDLWLNGVRDPLTGSWTGSSVGNQYFGQYTGGNLAYGVLGLVWQRALTDAEIIELSANPWQVFRPRRIWVPVSAATGGSTALVIQDASHGHTAEAVTLTSDSTLAVQDAAHGHTAESPTLTTEWLLTVADAAHAHSAENVTLGTSDATSLTVQDATHAHAADSVITSTDWLLSVADALHAHSTDGVTLDTAPVLVVADALHGHAADSPTLVTDSWLQPDDALHANAVDSVALGGVAAPPSEYEGTGAGGGMPNNTHRATILALEAEEAEALRIKREDEMVLDCITALVAAGVL